MKKLIIVFKTFVLLLLVSNLGRSQWTEDENYVTTNNSDANVGIGTKVPLLSLHTRNGIQLGVDETENQNFHFLPEAGNLVFYNGNHGAGSFLMSLSGIGKLKLGGNALQIGNSITATQNYHLTTGNTFSIFNGNEGTGTFLMSLDGLGKMKVAGTSLQLGTNTAGNLNYHFTSGNEFKVFNGNEGAGTFLMSLDGTGKMKVAGTSLQLGTNTAGNLNYHFTSGNEFKVFNGNEGAGTFLMSLDGTGKMKVAGNTLQIGTNVTASNNYHFSSNNGKLTLFNGNDGAGNFLMSVTNDGRMQIANGILQKGGSTTVTGTSDLGLYSSNSGDWIRLVTNSSPIKFFMDGGTSNGAGNSPIMAIEQIGSVGKGTITVDGKIISEELLVQIVNWPDYVFSEGYDLRSLEDVEKYINEKGYLPEMPSAHEVEKNGMNVEEMMSKLLKKIEELTLYTIEQSKKIQALEINLMSKSEKIND